MRWVDYFYSEEGTKYIEQGPEGVLWEYKENADGQKVRVYAEGIDTENTEDERGKITPAYGLTHRTLLSIRQVNIKSLKSADEQPDTRFQ